MVKRRTIKRPKGVDEKELTRLIEAGTRALRSGRAPAWIGSGESGLPDLGVNSDGYIREALSK